MRNVMTEIKAIEGKYVSETLHVLVAQSEDGWRVRVKRQGTIYDRIVPPSGILQTLTEGLKALAKAPAPGGYLVASEGETLASLAEVAETLAAKAGEAGITFRKCEACGAGDSVGTFEYERRMFHLCALCSEKI